MFDLSRRSFLKSLAAVSLFTAGSIGTSSPKSAQADDTAIPQILTPFDQTTIGAYLRIAHPEMYNSLSPDTKAYVDSTLMSETTNAATISEPPNDEHAIAQIAEVTVTSAEYATAAKQIHYDTQVASFPIWISVPMVTAGVSATNNATGRVYTQGQTVFTDLRFEYLSGETQVLPSGTYTFIATSVINKAPDGWAIAQPVAQLFHQVIIP